MFSSKYSLLPLCYLHCDQLGYHLVPPRESAEQVRGLLSHPDGLYSNCDHEAHQLLYRKYVLGQLQLGTSSALGFLSTINGASVAEAVS